MIQVGLSLRSPRPTTPPSTPPTLSDEDASEILAAMKMHPTSPNPHCYRSELLPFAQQFIDVVKSLSATQSTPAAPAAAEEVKAEDPPESFQTYKTVNEVWDEKAYKYVIEEQQQPEGKVDGLDRYVFIERRRIIKKTEIPVVYIDIKSRLLRDALRIILAQVPEISINEESLSVSMPSPTSTIDFLTFQKVERNVLFHYLPDLESSHKWNGVDPQDSDIRKHIALLIDHIKLSYMETNARLDSLLKNGEITYDLLSFLFKPNGLVYTTCRGTKKPRCIRFESGDAKTSTNGVDYFHIKGKYLEFDGKVLGKAPIETAILGFRGSRSINSLEAFPLQYHETEKNIRETLVKCGRKFCFSLIGKQHRQYRGKAFQMKKNKPVEIFINSRIMVDAASFQEINANYTRPSIFKSSDSIDLWLIVDAASSNQIDESATKSSMDLDALTDEDLLICSPTVLGFSLNDKLWLEFAVADISEISWNESLFNQLAMPSKSKKLIEALTTFQSGEKVKYTFDDFVVGKGRGLIMLLYGPPGVGKTMTAEGLSEHLKRPLYTVSAGNLSRDAKHLEVQLCEMFEVAENWNALLLLDEADDFLCKRSYDSNHNSLVSVFLRKLEYYQGIMLLTTNRVKDFDEAVQSRIHVGLKYGPLGVDTRKEIWRSFLETAKTEKGDAVYSDMQLNSLAEHSLNGRQASVPSMETYVPCFKVDAESMTDMASQYDPRGLSCFNDGTYQSNQFWCLRYELNKCRGSFDEHKQKDISARLTKVQELASFDLNDILETKVDMVVKELLDIARAIPGDKHQIRKRSRKLLWRLNGTKHSHCRWHARDREAKASLKDSEHIATMVIAKKQSTGYLEIIDLLIDKDAKVDTVDQLGRTPLHRSALLGHGAATKLLVDRGAVVDAVDNDGHTARDLAEEMDQEPAIRLSTGKSPPIPTAISSFITKVLKSRADFKDKSVDTWCGFIETIGFQNYKRHHMANRLYRNMTNVRKRQSQNASRRRSTLTNKAYEYAELYGADVALIIYQKGRYYTYGSPGNPCFPPSKKEIINSFPVPISMLPQDVCAKYQRKRSPEDPEQVGSTEKGCADTDIVKKTG
ncbi:hypothetical protein V501_02714 [Pseudogymnoascus sp. VKM F-4519 (FW-2642)]|nr:hypothetical protein V501_02714 [Pseudogymnoascus sp. VKM F-4519 (FW-2642)]